MNRAIIYWQLEFYGKIKILPREAGEEAARGFSL